MFGTHVTQVYEKECVKALVFSRSVYTVLLMDQFYMDIELLHLENVLQAFQWLYEI